MAVFSTMGKWQYVWQKHLRCYFATYLFAHCGLLRAFLRPNLRLSFILGSRFRKPNGFKTLRKAGSIFSMAREIPCRTASACEWMPPPFTFALTANFWEMLARVIGASTIFRNSNVGKYSSLVLLLIAIENGESGKSRTRATDVFLRPTASKYLPV